jgi:hypothetical protein
MSEHYKRPSLAKTLADEILGKSMLSDAPNGLFLAAPRRTGKTYFLRFDLLPQLRAEGLLAIYVDLWDNPDRSPMEVVAVGLAEAMQHNLGWVAKAAKNSGLQTFEIPGTGMKFDASRLGKTDGMSLRQILSLIRQQTGQRIALIIDEAQHALTSEEGESLMTALKSARDQMKEDGRSGLLLIMSGSHRDKLMGLLNSAAAPFWGAEVRALPTLGKDFALTYAKELERSFSQFKGLNAEGIADAFAQVGERPEFLVKLIQKASAQASDAAQFDQALATLAPGQRTRDREAMTQEYLLRSALEKAVIRRLVEQGDKFKAYDAAALAYYSAATGETVVASQVQNALDALRDARVRLVWKSLRGGYALYDQDMYEWYAYLKNSMQWPPTSASAGSSQDG